MVRFSLLPGWAIAALVCLELVPAVASERRPNVLIAISDDQSFAHTSIGGHPGVRTPAFDRVAENGVLFTNAFAPSPGCSPCRAAFLTGRQTWQLEHAGTHASSFSSKYITFPDLLEASGYFVGYTGKGWAPGNPQAGGRTRNPAGPAFSGRKLKPPHPGISATDYAGNFADFLEQRPAGQPFCFWYGGSEPHRAYAAGSGLREGKQRSDAVVPSFLPDVPDVQSDMLDYYVEIEWFDKQLAKILDQLDTAGELDNTLVIVTSDNGMPFPRAKANCYEYGIHMPLAVSWPAKAPGGRRIDDLVSLIDLTATILEAAGVEGPSGYPLTGRSLLDTLTSPKQGLVDKSRPFVCSARERHSSSRYNNLGYPIRALRTQKYLYVRNFKPDLWPAGDPQVYRKPNELGSMHGAYHDIDGSPSLTWLVENRDTPQGRKYFELAVAKRPAEELFDIQADPGCVNNLAGSAAHAETLAELRGQLETYLTATGDPRMGPHGDVFETYPRYSPIRSFPKPE